MKLRIYPDPILLRRAAPLKRIDARVRERVEEMFRVMYEEGGIGLAAPQVGWSVRLFVVNLAAEPGEGEELVYINPRITGAEGETVEEEGCLSIPDIRGKVARSQRVHVTAQGLDGEVFEQDVEDLHARAVQHELDHLDGILFIQRLGATEKLLIRSKLKKLAKEQERPTTPRR